MNGQLDIWIKIKCYLSKGLCNNGISPELRERKKLFSFYGKERRLSRSNQSRYKAENDKNSNCSWVDGCKGDKSASVQPCEAGVRCAFLDRTMAQGKCCNFR
uniref:Uncharacterized protein n=1 Tax=Oryza glaberrima TaxID=4538 RepID=I1P9Y6_ORYGL